MYAVMVSLFFYLTFAKSGGIKENVRGHCTNIRSILINIRGMTINARGLLINIRGILIFVKGILVYIRGKVLNVRDVSINISGMARIVTGIVLLCSPFYIWSQQPDSLVTLDPPDDAQELIEDFLQNTDSEGSFDFNTLFEKLADFKENPININKADEAVLRDLSLLSDAQILDLLAYRQTAGELISIYELQAVPSFDLKTIRRILPYITVRGSLDDYQIPLSEMLKNGKDEIYVRWSRILEPQKGFENTSNSRYLGDPNQLYVRYRHSYGTRLSYGITAEKDRGEEFFKGSNRQGFDFYSAHLFARDLNKVVKAAALGDYSVSLGQGLVVYTGFGVGKSSSPLTLKRTGRVLSPYTSANEVNFFAGRRRPFV